LNTQYSGTEKATTDDLAKHIKVTAMYNRSSATNAVVETTLADLQNQTPNLTQIDTFVGSTTKPDGIPAGGKEKIFVLFEFIDQKRKNAIRR
jgi:spore coat-associated protein N